MAVKIFHPLLALIASATNNELTRYVEFLKEENKILRARVPGQIHTRTDERSRLVKLGKAMGRDRRQITTETTIECCRIDYGKAASSAVKLLEKA